MSQPMYTTVDSVKARLTNKVQFQSGKKPIDGELPDELLCQIISDAETDVEMALRGRYAIPFRSIAKGNFSGLPDHTKRAIRKAVDYKAAVLVLETDFGRGTAVDGDNYSKNLKNQYKEAVSLLMGVDLQAKNLERVKVAPPLEDLMLAKSNAKADDGFRGTIINTDASPDGAEQYAADQVNDPSKIWYRNRIGGL